MQHGLDPKAQRSQRPLFFRRLDQNRYLREPGFERANGRFHFAAQFLVRVLRIARTGREIGQAKPHV